MPGHDLYVDTALFSVPAWMPPVSIDDNAALHESLLDILPHVVVGAHEFSFKPDLLWRVVSVCWQRRLPLQRSDIWPLIQAHGVSVRHKSRVLDFFDFGVKLLTVTHGRPAIKRKRMVPMSKGRYLTRAQRDLRIQLFGHH